MPLEHPIETGFDRLEQLQQQFENLSAQSILAAAADHPLVGRVALASSFGAEAAVLLHMLARIDSELPVLFIDTELLFPETLAYQSALATRLGLRNVVTLKADRARLFAQDPDNLLNHFDPDACCTLRKTEPLEQALESYDSWITGRKQFHGGQRAQLPLLEYDAKQRIKINPLYNWSAADMAAYRTEHNLPEHPLIKRGYGSIGCRPCTRPLHAGETGRDGRWDGSDKTECGIHLLSPMKGAA
ncbi:MAG: phosphoadenylyl-sulfate reductase [Alphaproteobacteria bacterium]|nr:phosphoadenylyl-sulfate reductase [Alphaproteobacteria bacterium]